MSHSAAVSEADKLAVHRTDFVVVGSGVAGLWAALSLARHGRVALVTKAELQEGSTRYAQGGIAVALASKDGPEPHLQDTLVAGAGLCDVPAVEVLTYEASQAVADLMDAGVRFDQEDGQLVLGREAAHSHRRILHAGGDSTGAEVERALTEKARSSDSIDIYEEVMATRLLVVEGRCAGVDARDLAGEANLRFVARATCLATGGLGALYRRTTNPMVSTGDGIALAFRAGAVVRDMEFIQFHPTALATPGTPKFLISEAVRGEGAVLKDVNGEPFMQRYHAQRELAPRDEVARAVWSEMKKSGEAFVYLDFAPIGRDRINGRFPGIVGELRKRGFEPHTDLIPVAPAAHYYMGGVDVDLRGATSVPGLYACGECACTGAHGANRLASNSLLEGLVFGGRAARAMLKLEPLPARALATLEQLAFAPIPVAEDVYGEIREMMWDDVGIIRSEHSLNNALKNLARLNGALGTSAAPERWAIERANMILVADIIVRAALNRKESRGAHYRTDHPEQSADRLFHNLLYQDQDSNVRTSNRPVDTRRFREPLPEEE